MNWRKIQFSDENFCRGRQAGCKQSKLNNAWTETSKSGKHDLSSADRLLVYLKIT